uniref:Uncharacterized protein n=1 Tax=uncultured Nocardioidaceae bacterium TaxID=253824 RepID=A0A6J4LDL1_9ACTN|nr:MAG: hypothetical protein AVDCRST_MAG46-1415 [uncultured Nocardioidaceae bacterium]
MDLARELEQSIPPGPPPPPPAERLVAGRRALRRRRASVAVGAVAAVVALAVPVAALDRTADRGTGPTPVAPAPSATDRPGGEDPRSEPTRSPEWPGGKEDLAWVDFDTGELRIHPDAVVHKRRDGLFPRKRTESVALDLSVDDQRQWVVLEWDERGGAVDVTDPTDGSYGTFDDFVDEVVRTSGVQHGPTVNGRDRSGAHR